MTTSRSRKRRRSDAGPAKSPSIAGISQTSGTYSPSAPALSFLPAMRTLRPVTSSRVPNGMPVPISTSPWRDEEFLGTLPLRRLVRPDEVAEAVLFLVEEGSFFCGQVLSPNAGAVI